MSVAGGLPPVTGAYTDADPFAANPVTPTHPTVPLVAEDGMFNPYADYNPPPSAFHMGAYRDRTGSGAVAAAAATAAGIVANGDRERRNGAYEMGNMGNNRNSASYNTAAQEPLLANYQGQTREPSPPNVNGGSGTSQRNSAVEPPPYTLHPTAGGSSQPALLVPQSTSGGRTSTASSVYSTASGPVPDGDTKTGLALTTDEPEPNVFRDYFFGSSGNGDADAQSASAASSSTKAVGGRGSVAVETPSSMPFFTPIATPGGAVVTTPRDNILDPTLRERFNLMDAGDMDLRDDEDYSRRMLGPTTVASSSTSGTLNKGVGGGKVLGVRNPDTDDPTASDLGRESWTPRAF